MGRRSPARRGALSAQLLPLGLALAAAIGPVDAHAQKKGSYTYTARFSGPIRGGAVVAQSIRWTCQTNACTVTGPWPTPGVSACGALARELGRTVVAYGHPGRSLSAAELERCNQGVGGHAARSLTPSAAAAAVAAAQRPTGPVGKPTAVHAPSVASKKKIPAGRSPFATHPTGASKKKGAHPTGALEAWRQAGALRATTAPDPAVLTGVMRNQSRFRQLASKRDLQKAPVRLLEGSSSIRIQGTRHGGDDCDDQRGDVHPTANETCDGVDNDCDGYVDENQTLLVYLDADGDTHGDPNQSMEACLDDVRQAQSQGRWLVTVGNDCDDSDPTRWHGCEAGSP